MRRLPLIDRSRLDAVVRSDRDIQQLLRISIVVPEQQVEAAIRIRVPPFERRRDARAAISRGLQRKSRLLRSGQDGPAGDSCDTQRDDPPSPFQEIPLNHGWMLSFPASFRPARASGVSANCKTGSRRCPEPDACRRLGTSYTQTQACFPREGNFFSLVTLRSDPILSLHRRSDRKCREALPRLARVFERSAATLKRYLSSEHRGICVHHPRALLIEES